VCTRIIVRDGRITGEFAADGLTEHSLVRAMEGKTA
jgi:hypothetical protein